MACSALEHILKKPSPTPQVLGGAGMRELLQRLNYRTCQTCKANLPLNIKTEK